MSTSQSAPHRSRVLILSQYYWPEVSGNGPYVTGLAEYLAGHGHDVEVATGFPHFPQWRPTTPRKLRDIEERNGVRILRSWHTVPRKQSAVSRALYELSSLSAGAWSLSGHRPDVVVGIVPNLSGAVGSYALSRRFGAPYVLVFQDLMGLAATQNGVAGGERVAGAVRRIELQMARKADAVGIVTNGFASYLSGGGVSPDRLHLLRNWTRASSPKESRDDARQRLGWQDDEFVCLHAGNMGRKQGLDNLLHAAALLQEECATRLRVVLAGDGNDRERLQAKAQAMRLPNVTFLGQQPPGHYESMLRAADVLLVNQRPSLSDAALPSKLTSYFPAARPIVAAASEDSETAKEVRASGAGVLVQPDDAAALANTLIQLADDRDSAMGMAKNARMYATNLEPEVALSAYEQLLDTAMNGGAA